MPFSNQVNAYSTLDSPAIGSNNGETYIVKINNIDSTDFTLTPSGELVCVNPGKWRFLAQYQAVYSQFGGLFSDEPVYIDGLFRLEDRAITFSDATTSVSKLSPKNVLAIELEIDLLAGQRLSICVSSSNTKAGICRAYTNFGNLDASGNPTNDTGEIAPSVIFSASKIPV